MDGEIILDRGNTNVMKLDDREQALMDEIEISVPKHQPVKRPLPTQFTPPPTQQFQEDIDSFANFRSSGKHMTPLTTLAMLSSTSIWSRSGARS